MTHELSVNRFNIISLWYPFAPIYNLVCPREWIASMFSFPFNNVNTTFFSSSLSDLALSLGNYGVSQYRDFTLAKVATAFLCRHLLFHWNNPERSFRRRVPRIRFQCLYVHTQLNNTMISVHVNCILTRHFLCRRQSELKRNECRKIQKSRSSDWFANKVRAFRIAIVINTNSFDQLRQAKTGPNKPNPQYNCREDVIIWCFQIRYCNPQHLDQSKYLASWPTLPCDRFAIAVQLYQPS